MTLRETVFWHIIKLSFNIIEEGGRWRKKEEAERRVRVGGGEKEGFEEKSGEEESCERFGI